jgi:hypothetical protein
MSDSKQDKVVNKEVKATKKIQPKEFGQQEAEKLAASYVPKEEEKRYENAFIDGKDIQVDKFDVMYVTSDKNVFFKKNEGSARTHARNNKLELFTIKL